MRGIREEYKSAKVALLSEQSEDNYKEMLSACYDILAYHSEICREDGFADVLQVYERTALSFWEQYKTVESLCQIIYFYSDWELLGYFNCMSDKKQHLLKGLKYVRQYHDMKDADYSACVYVDYYLSLCEACGTMEYKEQFSYAEKAYDLAKMYLLEYQTDQMLEQYKLTAKARVAYYRMEGCEEPAAEVERECKELAADISGKISRSMRSDQGINEVPKERDIYGCLEDMCCNILPHSEEIVGKHRKDIWHFIRVCLKIRDIAHYKGLDPLMQTAEALSKRNVQYCQMLAYGIRSFCGCDEELAEKMLEHFSTQQEDCYMKFILYMCIRFLLLLQCGASERLVKIVLFSMIHPKERKLLKEYLKYKLN